MPDIDPIRLPTPPRASDAARPPAATPTKVCLLILFNHRFDANLPKLDWLYRGRFEHIRYLVPFYHGDRTDVIPGFYASFRFQTVFVDAWRELRGQGFTHFVVCADDMVLNPRLNDKNILAAMGLDGDPDTAFFKQLVSFADRGWDWFPGPSAFVTVAGNSGTNWEGEVPPADLAAANLEAKGHPLGRLGWHNLRHGIRAKGLFLMLFYFVLRLLKRRRVPGTDLRGLPYPLLSGNADLMVLPASCMDKFTFYCGVFAAIGLFVEIAAPTSLTLACPRVLVQHDTDWIMHDHFCGTGGPENLDSFCERYDYRLDRLVERFEENVLCYHPIKLSGWSYPGSTGSGGKPTAA